jgi:polyphosphate kinase
MKMNSLLDAPMIKALYEASGAGVEVELNVRGICSLRPGVPGVSENITVVSVLGRFLEHSRLYVFERGGRSHAFMGSADLMPRNLYNRVELVIPVEDEAARRELIDFLDRCMGEAVGAWVLGADGAWGRRERREGDQHVQQALIERHSTRSAEAGAFATGVHSVV